MPTIPLADPNTLHALELGNRVIQLVKESLGQVPLNINRSVGSTRLEEVEGFAKVWTRRELNFEKSELRRGCDPAFGARHQGRLDQGQIRNIQPGNPAMRPNVVVSAFTEARIGMCQDYASLSYKLLRLVCPPGVRVSYVFAPGPVHFFTTIGDFDQRHHNPNSIVVVDAWYQHADAVLYPHSHHLHAKYEGDVVYCKPGKGTHKLADLNLNMVQNLVFAAASKYGAHLFPDEDVRFHQGVKNKEWMVNPTNGYEAFRNMQYGNDYTYMNGKERVSYVPAGPPSLPLGIGFTGETDMEIDG